MCACIRIHYIPAIAFMSQENIFMNFVNLLSCRKYSSKRNVSTNPETKKTAAREQYSIY